jgi:hypothetical protein
MISNMFNYPNPFTTSTAFVFTVTGSQVPQNIRIQVLTITGKIVKEITKENWGLCILVATLQNTNGMVRPIWSKTANGVYLYSVITNLMVIN